MDWPIMTFILSSNLFVKKYKGVLAENMLFATLDPTTRKVKLPRVKVAKAGNGADLDEVISSDSSDPHRSTRGQEILLTDTVGFISKLPTDLIAAFRATLEEVLLRYRTIEL
jgi:GTP-binding protein HflX